MRLILYGKEEKDFTSLGLGVLTDVRNDEVIETLNEKFELTLQYPATGPHFGDLVLDAWIKARPNQLAEPQPFRIYHISKVRSGFVTVKARHLCYQLKHYVCGVWNGVGTISQWLPELPSHIAPACPFSFSFCSDVERTSGLYVKRPVDVWTLLGSNDDMILSVVRCEYEFDGYQVIMHTQRGTDRGVSIRYGKNLRDLTHDRSRGEEFNGLYPYYVDDDGKCHELPELYIMRSSYTEGDEKMIRVADCSTTATTTAEIVERNGSIENYLRNCVGFVYMSIDLTDGNYFTVTPENNIIVDFVQLSKTTEYADYPLSDGIAPGDTIHIEDPELDVSVAARVREVRFQPSTGLYKSVSLGSVRPSVVRTIVQRTTAPSTDIHLDAAAVSAMAE